MIYSLRGKIEILGSNHLVLATSEGISFLVFVSGETLRQLLGKEGAEIKMFTSLHFRESEETFNLYGFLSEEELKFFHLLNTVSGVGPKMALAVLGVADLKDLKTAIASQKVELLSRAGGVGKKTAERIIVELKDKVVKDEKGVEMLEIDLEVREALQSLGYGADEIRDALKKIPEAVTDFSGRLKAALKALGRK